MASKAKAKKDEDPRFIYVIQIAPKWVETVRPGLDPDVECLYVGQSKKRPGKRFKLHRRGYPPKKNPGDAAARVFRKIHAARLADRRQGTLVKGEDAWLRWDLMNDLKPVEGRKKAEALERATADRFRSDGYFVFGPKANKAERRELRRAVDR